MKISVPKKKRPTMDDVAQLAGVSNKTVSRVFNDEPHVRPETREVVVQAAEQLSYRPNQSARRLATNRAYVIGMVYANPNSEYLTEIHEGSIKVCRREGYSLLIHPCEPSSPTLVEELLDLHQRATIDGFVVLQPISDVPEFNQALLEGEIPCVRVSQRPFSGLPWVSVGDEEAAEEMANYLVRLGHRRIGFIMGHPEHGSSHDRLAGYRKALDAHGIDVDDDLIMSGRFDFESGYLCARKLLDAHPRPTAIFASNDNMALATLTAAHERRLEIPRDLSVAGFDDSSSSRFLWPPLTTVRQPIAEVGRIATQILLQRLRGTSVTESDHRLRAELIHRSSTGPVESRN